MKNSIKKEFILEGLHCANCALKIEENLRKLEGVQSVSLNFNTKTLTINANDNENMEIILMNTDKIIKSIESHVIIKEKSVYKPEKLVLMVFGLNCTACATKIEKKIQTIRGVKSARLDFASKKLVLTLNRYHNIDYIIKEANVIAKAIETGVHIAKQSDNNDKDDVKNLWSTGVGAVLFLIPVIFNLPQPLELVLYIISYLIIGGEVLLKAFKNIIHGRIFDENFLMVIATFGAFAITEYAEGVAVMLFYQTGEYFQSLAVNRSRKSITALMDIRPEYANLKTYTGTKKVSPEQVSTGDIILVKPGEKIPLDGVVVEGTSALDKSALTGESVRSEVQAGNTVLSGSINITGLLTIRVTKEYSESTVSKILDLVENASGKKASSENFITKFARIYTPAVVVSALALAIIPPLIIPGAVFSHWFHRSLVFLVVSCPCALVISIPLSFFGGIGGASANGILVKGGNYLEALNNIDTVVFDKTGTLTKGTFEVTKIVTKGALSEQELLEFAAYAESYSNHPIAISILKFYGKRTDKSVITEYKEMAGYGVAAKIRGIEILAGNSALMKKKNILFSEAKEETGTILYIAKEGKYQGYITISDEIKKDSKKTVSTLRKMGVRNIAMLTGDKKAVAEHIGVYLKIDKVYSELLPHQKVEILERLRNDKPTKGNLIFVGDGINDAPVLAGADIGIAMGGLGSDAAIEAADIVLMTDEPFKLVTAIQIAGKTRNIVWQNIIFALAVKGVVLLLGAFGTATMWEAVFADVGVALIAVLNSIRTANYKPDKTH